MSEDSQRREPVADSLGVAVLISSSKVDKAKENAIRGGWEKSEAAGATVLDLKIAR